MLSKLNLVREKIAKVKKWVTNKPGQMKYVYAWHLNHAKVRSNRVLFESFHGKDISDSPYYIYKALEEMGRLGDYEIYFATSDMQRHSRQVAELGMKVRLVDVSSFDYTRILATSKYLINNSSFPAYFMKREDQRYLQTWHGTPLKTLGKQMRFGIESMYNVQHNFLHADYIMFPNEFTRDVIMRDYNLNDLFTHQTVLNGYPRNSVFSHPEKGDQVRTALGNDNITTLAYMPTWRGQSNHSIEMGSYRDEMNQMLARIDESLTDGQKLYVNFHPIVAKEVKLASYRHILPFPDGIDKYEFLNSVDALITDYSSVFFDFSITRKPVILFMYDYDKYMTDRGVYFDIRTLPFRKIYTVEDLIDCLSTESFRADDYAHDTDYINRFIQYDSADSGLKMARLIFDGVTDGLPMEDYARNRDRKWSVCWPDKFSSTNALDACCRSIQPNELMVFDKTSFTPRLSAHLYDNYNDAFTYLFLTNSNPRTLFEDFLAAVSGKARKKLHRRNIRRCFPDLTIGESFRRTYYHGEVGEEFHCRSIPAVNTTATLENEHLLIRLSDADLPKAVLLARENAITWRRLLTEEEEKASLIDISLADVVEQTELVENETLTLLLEYEKADGSHFIKAVKDPERFEKGSKAAALNDHTPFCLGQAVFTTRLKGKEKIGSASILPRLAQDTGWLGLFVCQPANAVNALVNARVRKMRFHGSKMELVAALPATAPAVVDLRFNLRNAVRDVRYSLPYTSRKEGDWIVLDCRADMDDYALEPQYWDINVIVTKDGQEHAIGLYPSRLRRLGNMFLNAECRVKNGTGVLFPYRKRLAFAYRERSKYDNMSQRLKEIAAALVYYPLMPYWDSRRIWLVYEKFCVAAQENGWYFFKYCMDNLPPAEKKHIFYIMDPASPDWEKTQAYKDNVIRFMSFRHLVYLLAAKLYIAPDSRKHIYQWRAKPNIISNRIERRPLLFLQHGVTALKRVHPLFGKGCSSEVTHFVTTSEYEQKIITTYFGYQETDVPILGFCRWDVLKDHADPKDKILLIMPTWRLWLEETPDEEFVRSEYYQRYSGLLQNERLKQYQEQYNFRIIFFIHPKLSDKLREFEADSRYVELVPFGSRPLNDIIMKSSMLITDYSSVSWDEYYLGKPVLFYQFDTENYIKAHGGSYMDFETELFGDRFTEEEDLVEAIGSYAAGNFQEKELYRQMRPSLFTYQDDHNSARTYDYIISKGY